MLKIEITGPALKPADEEAIRLVATGRGTLAFLVGEKESRFRLFSDCINWDRVLLARLDGQVVGFLAFQWRRTGPYAPSLGDFVAEFGLLSAVWRWLAFYCLEMRTWRRGFYIYGFKVLRQARRKGVASALLKAAEAHAGILGAGVIELEVHDMNHRAQCFYEERGFDLSGVSRLWGVSRLFGFSALLRMRKSLG